MSDDGRDTGKTPESKAPEEQQPVIATMGLKAEKALAYAEQSHRERIGERLKALLESGRCTPAEHDAYSRELPAIRLSLNDSGQPIPSALETFIASREPVPKGAFWSGEDRAQRMGLDEADAPESWTVPNEMSDKDKEDLVARHLKAAGVA